MTEPGTTFGARLHEIANYIDAWDLPTPTLPSFYFFVDTIEDAVKVRDVMIDPDVQAKNDPKYPAEINGRIAGFPVTVFVRACANPVVTAVRVQLPDLDPRLLAPVIEGA